MGTRRPPLPCRGSDQTEQATALAKFEAKPVSLSIATATRCVPPAQRSICVRMPQLPEPLAWMYPL